MDPLEQFVTILFCDKCTKVPAIFDTFRMFNYTYSGSTLYVYLNCGWAWVEKMNWSFVVNELKKYERSKLRREYSKAICSLVYTNTLILRLSMTI